MSSRETDSIISYVRGQVPDVVVTATVGRYVSPSNPCAPHSPGSYHCKEGTGGAGLAVDFGGTPAQQLAAFNALKPAAGQLAELIHNPAGAVKNGKWVDPVAVYGATVWAAHTNHTHVAVNAGAFLAVPSIVTAAPTPGPLVPAPVHDFEENNVKQTMMHIGALDGAGNGWASWDPGLGRDPNIVAVTLLGPNPPTDGYWDQQKNVTLAAQPHGGTVLVTVRNGTPGDTVTAWVTVS